MRRAAALMVALFLIFQTGAVFGNGVEQIASHLVDQVFPDQEGN